MQKSDMTMLLVLAGGALVLFEMSKKAAAAAPANNIGSDISSLETTGQNFYAAGESAYNAIGNLF